MHFHPKTEYTKPKYEKKLITQNKEYYKRQKTKQANNWEQRTKQLGKNLEAYIPTPSNKSSTHVLKAVYF